VMRKGLRREGVVSTIRGLSELGIASTCSFVIGFPDETPEELSATVGEAAELKLIGAGLVQFHRLRTWPPAPLSRAALPSEFDLDSLRIEYPFLDVPREDVAAVEADPEFFAGYFAPHSSAGTFAQLAQVELFFTQAVAVAPLTVAVMGRLAGESLIPSFYEVLARRGPVTREQIESNPAGVLHLWELLRPYLEEWVAAHTALEEWQRELVCAAMLYEGQRLIFVDSDGAARAGMNACGEDWAAFVTNADIGAIFEAMQDGRPLTAELVRQRAVVLARHAEHSYRAYTTDAARLADLPARALTTETAVAG
jgi:hypothetical protein